MPSPSSSLATLRPDLGGSLEEFSLEANQQGFIALRVLPVFEAAKASGNFGRIPIEQLLKARDTERSPGSGYARGRFTFIPDTYTTREQGAEDPVDDNEQELYRDYFDAEQVAAARARHAVLVSQEIRAAAALFNATTWTGSSLTTAIVNEWDDPDNATPIDDVEAAVRKVYTGSGLWPNALIINRLVFRNLRLCAAIIDRITSMGAGNPAKPSDITAQMLAQCFDLEEVIVAGGSKDTATEGQSSTPGQIWSNEYAMVARVCRTGDIKEPGVGRTFHWSDDGSEIGAMMETYREEQTRSEIVRARHQVGEKILYTEAAHLLSNITT